MGYVGAGFLFREPSGRYLFVLRSQNPRRWEIPGGHAEKGEIPYETAKREALEEIAILPPHAVRWVDYSKNGRKKPYWAFQADVSGCFTPRLSDEHVDHRWMTIPEALADPIPVHPKLRKTLLAHQLPKGGLSSKSKFTRLKPTTRVTVYHGTSLMNVADLINGFDANELVPRDYGGPRHAGLFVAPDIATSERFAAYGEILLEIQTPAKNLHGTDYSGRTGKQQRRESDLSWIDEKYPDSFRPYLTYTLNQANEPQALLRGLVKPNQIKRVRYKPYGQEPIWFTRKQFLDLGLKSDRRSSGRTGRYLKDIRQAGCDLASTKLSAQEVLDCIAVTLDEPMDRVEKAVTLRIRVGGLDKLLRSVGFGDTAIKSHVKSLKKFYRVPAGKMSAVRAGVVVTLAGQKFWCRSLCLGSSWKVHDIHDNPATIWFTSATNKITERPFATRVVLDQGKTSVSYPISEFSFVSPHGGWDSDRGTWWKSPIPAGKMSARDLRDILPKDVLDGEEEFDDEEGEEGVLVKNIPMGALSMLQSQGEAILTDIRRGELSMTEGLPVLFYNTEKQQLIVDDGNHRIFQRWLKGEDKFDAYVYSGSYSGHLREVCPGEEKFDWSEDYRSIPAGKMSARSLKPLYGSNFYYEMNKYVLEKGGLAQYGVSYSEYPKWGVNPQAKWFPYGVWFYYLSPQCDAGLSTGFATDRRWANIAKLNNDRLLINKRGHPAHFDEHALSSALVYLEEKYGPLPPPPTESSSGLILTPAEKLVDVIIGITDATARFNLVLHEVGYDGIVDYDGSALPIESCQGVITWVKGGSKYVTSIRAGGESEREKKRLSNMLTNLQNKAPGSLKLNQDEIRRVSKMLPEFHHKWDIRESRADLFGALMRVLDFRHADSWEWVEKFVDDGFGDQIYPELERNPTTPRQFWEGLQHSRDKGARLAAKDMLEIAPIPAGKMSARRDLSSLQLVWFEEEEEYEGDPYALAQSVGINILSDKEFRAGYAVEGILVAALFDSSQSGDQECYSFDVVVDAEWQGYGLGSKLIDLAIELYDELTDPFPNIQFCVDAVNPAVVRLLKRRGFVVSEERGEHTLMTRSTPPGKMSARRDLRDVRISRGTITIGDRKPIPIKKIGQGMFAKAYATTKGKPRVFLEIADDAGDYSKEMLSSISNDTRSKYLPKTTKIGVTPTSTIYEQPLYKAPLRKADSAKAWKEYRTLEKCWQEALRTIQGRGRGRYWIYDGYDLQHLVRECAKSKKLSPALIRALELLTEETPNYGTTYSFEFAPRNLATDAKGNLILLDVLFDLETVQKRSAAGGRMRAGRSCPVRSQLYGGIPGGGGYTNTSEYEIGARDIAEAAHCILGSLGKAMLQEGESPEGVVHRWRIETGHFQEEMGIIEKSLKEYRRPIYLNQLNDLRGRSRDFGEPQAQAWRKRSIDNIREASPLLRDTAKEMLGELDGVEMEGYARTAAIHAYMVLISLAEAMLRSVKTKKLGPSAFDNPKLIENVSLLRKAISELPSSPQRLEQERQQKEQAQVDELFALLQ